MKFGRAPTTNAEREPTRGRSYRRLGYTRLRARAQERCSGSRWARSSGRTSLYPLGAAALARVRTRRVRKEAIEPAVTVIVAAYNEEPVIERRLENLLALDYPADKLERRRHLRRVDRPHARARRAVRRPGAADRQPARRQGRRPEPGRARDRGRDRRLLRRERDLGAGCAASARRELRRPRRRLRLRAARARGGRRVEPRGPLLALRAGAARGGVAARLGHRRQRLDLRRAPLRLRRGRPEVGPRPLVPVPDGAGAAAARSTSRRRRRSRSRRRRTRPSTGARCACSSTAGRSPCAARC